MCPAEASLVQCGAGGHAARQALHACPLEVRDAGDVGRDDGYRVRGVDEEAVLTEHHVAVLGRGWDHTKHTQNTIKGATLRVGADSRNMGMCVIFLLYSTKKMLVVKICLFPPTEEVEKL